MFELKDVIEGISLKGCIGNIICSFYFVIFLSHLTGIFISSNINTLSQIGLVTTAKDRFEIIMSSISAFNPILDVNGGVSCVLQRDKTQILSEFDLAAFSTRKRLFYIPSFHFIALDDELMGTRSQSIARKFISIRKADL